MDEFDRDRAYEEEFQMARPAVPGENPALDRLLGHRMRQRERSQSGSWDDFRSQELIEVLLGCAVPRSDQSALARRLVERFGGAMDVLLTPEEALSSVPGMTPAMVEWLKLTGELVTLYRMMDAQGGVPMGRFIDVQAYLKPRLGWVEPPESWILYTDFENNLLCRQPQRRGVPWWDPSNMRQVVLDGISLQASHAVLALFRGDGPLRMSPEELRRLDGICIFFDAIQVSLLDCVLVGDSGMYSMNIHGRYPFLKDVPRKAFLHERYGEGMEPGL